MVLVPAMSRNAEACFGELPTMAASRFDFIVK